MLRAHKRRHHPQGKETLWSGVLVSHGCAAALSTKRVSLTSSGVEVRYSDKDGEKLALLQADAHSADVQLYIGVFEGAGSTTGLRDSLFRIVPKLTFQAQKSELRIRTKIRQGKEVSLGEQEEIEQKAGNERMQNAAKMQIREASNARGQHAQKENIYLFFFKFGLGNLFCA